MAEAARLHAETGKPARVFSEFAYQTTTGSWSQGRANRCTRICTAHAGRWRTASRSSCRDSRDDGLQLSAAMPVRAAMGGVALLRQPPGRHRTRNPLGKGKCGRKRFGIPAGRSAGALPPQDDAFQRAMATSDPESLRQNQPTAAPLGSSRPCPITNVAPAGSWANRPNRLVLTQRMRSSSAARAPSH